MNENELLFAICNQLVQVIVNLGGTQAPITGGHSEQELLRIQINLLKQIIALT